MFFNFTGEDNDSEKFKSKISQFIIESTFVNVNPNDQNPQGDPIPIILPQDRNIPSNVTIQRDLKSFLLRKSKENFEPKSSDEQSPVPVEVLITSFGSQVFEVHVMQVMLDLLPSIAIQLNQIEERDKKKHNTFNEPMQYSPNNIQLPNQQQQSNQAFNQVPLKVSFQGKKNNFNNSSTQFQQFHQSNRCIQTPTAKNNNLNNQSMVYSEEPEEDLLSVCNSVFGYLKSSLQDLNELLNNQLLLNQQNAYQIDLKACLEILISEQAMLRDVVLRRVAQVTGSKTVLQQTATPQIVGQIGFALQQQNNNGNQVGEGIKQNAQSTEQQSQSQLQQQQQQLLGQLRYFEFDDIVENLRLNLIVHGITSNFVITKQLNSQFKLLSIKDSLDSLLSCSVQLIAEMTGIRQKKYSSSGEPHEETRPIRIQFYQLAGQNSSCTIGVRFLDIPHPQLLNPSKQSKQAILFHGLMKSYLEKIGISSSLTYSPSSQNFRFVLSYIILADCSATGMYQPVPLGDQTNLTNAQNGNNITNYQQVRQNTSLSNYRNENNSVVGIQSQYGNNSVSVILPKIANGQQVRSKDNTSPGFQGISQQIHKEEEKEEMLHDDDQEDEGEEEAQEEKDEEEDENNHIVLRKSCSKYLSSDSSMQTIFKNISQLNLSPKKDYGNLISISKVQIDKTYQR